MAGHSYGPNRWRANGLKSNAGKQGNCDNNESAVASVLWVLQHGYWIVAAEGYATPTTTQYLAAS